MTFTRLRPFCAILRILNLTARFDGVGAAAKRGELYPDDLACEPDLPKLPRFVADDAR